MSKGEYKPPLYPGPKRICEREIPNEQKRQSFPHLQSFLAEYSHHPLRLTLIMLFSSAAALLGAVAVAMAQTDFPNEAAVPRGQPIPGNYTGALRPQIHYSPPQGFMNDPNGMFLDPTGVWHLYYQYNPTDIVAGNQHWGHATSRDLYRWTNQPIAVFPETATENIFSGSIVIDSNNTSGFFPNQTDGVVAIFTVNTPDEQTQDIAYSTDLGYSFTRYQANPVLRVNSTQFRDPKVIWHAPTQKWVMVLAFAQEFVIGVYTSPNLKEWSFASNFSHHGLLGLQYEVPILQQIRMEGSDEEMWVMLISINPGAPLGGSTIQYFPGQFNGTHFEAVDAAARLLDFGKDNYAGGFFYGTPADQDPVFISWASNWQYSQVVPTGELEGWRSAMTIPRTSYMTNITRLGYDLVQKPYNLETVYDAPLATNSSVGNGSVFVDFSTLYSNAIYFQVNVTNIPTTKNTGTANFTFASSVSGERVRGGFYFGGDVPFFIDRGDSRGFDNPFFTDKVSINNLIENGTWRMEGVFDRSILEVFLDGGKRSATTTFFPTQSLNTLLISTGELNEGVEVSVAIWGLQSTWANSPSNTTTSPSSSTSSASNLGPSSDNTNSGSVNSVSSSSSTMSTSTSSRYSYSYHYAY
ncbi:MAG: hypothetical protein M1816_003773 [Peltula sp. TS41687]|nr:MAG: hypothetical protein M1816_003773 [Peltula sp. TS41687]